LDIDDIETPRTGYSQGVKGSSRERAAMSAKIGNMVHGALWLRDRGLNSQGAKG
jgi:hypothetical protein